MKQKITVHELAQFGTSQNVADAIAAGAKMVKIVNNAVRAVQLAEAFPNVLVIYRRVEPDGLKNLSDWKNHPDWPTPAACASIQVLYCQVPKALPNLAIEPALNEPVLNSVDDAVWLGQVEAYRARELKSKGLRAVIGCFATGNPSTAMFVEFMRAYHDAGGPADAIIATHEYGHYKIRPADDAKHPERNLTRYRVLRAAALPYCDGMKWAITETGLDRVTSVAYGPGLPFGLTGWNEEQYADYLIDEYGGLLSEDDYVIGATVFTSRTDGSPLWDPFDVDPRRTFSARLNASIRANPPDAIVWTPKPPPVPQPVKIFLPAILKDAVAKPASYVVKAGDTLGAIARRFGMALADVLQLNPQVTDANRIDVGQIIRLIRDAISRPDVGAAAIAWDISRYQELFDSVGRVTIAIDWPLVAQERGDFFPDFFFVRVTTGVGVDISFARSWTGTRSISRPRGGYANIRHDVKAVDQVDAFFRAVGDDVGELRPAIDIETKATPAYPYHDRTSASQYARVIDEVVNTVFRRTGKTPILYTGGWFWRPAFELNGIRNNFGCPLWLAQYPLAGRAPALADLQSGRYRPSVPVSWSTWSVWQVTDSFRTPGIRANTVDVDLIRNEAVADLWLK